MSWDHDKRMTTAVLVCPECGRRQHAEIVKHDPIHTYRATVRCKSCGHTASGHDFGAHTPTESVQLRRERNRRYREKHPERVRAQKKAYRDSHREQLRAYERRNRERINANARARYDPDKAHERWKAWYAENRDEYLLRKNLRRLYGGEK